MATKKTPTKKKASAPKQPSPGLIARGKRLAKLREDLGLSQDELAARVGVKGLQISRLERGVQGAKSRVWGRIAREVGIDLATLDTKDAGPQTSDYPEREAMLRSADFKAAPEPVRKWVLRLRPDRPISEAKWWEMLSIARTLYDASALHET